MLIGELARTAGVSRDTIRYYEREGLLEHSFRRDNNYREYPTTAVNRLQFIKALQERGFTLGEIQDLLRLTANGAVTCGETGERVRAKLREIDAQIDALSAMKTRLQRTFDYCSGNAPTDACTPVAEMRLTP